MKMFEKELNLSTTTKICCKKIDLYVKDGRKKRITVEFEYDQITWLYSGFRLGIVQYLEHVYTKETKDEGAR